MAIADELNHRRYKAERDLQGALATLAMPSPLPADDWPPVLWRIAAATATLVDVDPVLSGPLSERISATWQPLADASAYFTNPGYRAALALRETLRLTGPGAPAPGQPRSRWDENKLQERRESLRHRILMNAFRRLDAPGDPWMSRASPTDDEVITVLGKALRCATTIHSFGDAHHWTALTTQDIAGMEGGRLIRIPYGEVIDLRDGLTVDGHRFWAADAVRPKLDEALRLLLVHVRAGD